MRKILLLVLPVTLLLASCDLFNNYGKKYKLNDKNEIYYKGDGVTESDAKKLGDFLLEYKWLDSTKGSSVQLQKDKDEYWVRYVYDKDYYNKNEHQVNMSFWYLQDMISTNVFDGKPVRIALADNKFKDFQTMDPITKVSIDKNLVYYKGDGIKEADAKDIGEKLAKEEFFPFTGGGILLTKEKGELVIRFLPSEDKLKEGKDHYFAVLTNLQYIFSKYTLNQDVKLVVIDNEFNDVQQFGEPTDAQKQYMDNAMTGKQTNNTDDQAQDQQDQTQSDPYQTGANPNQ
jgi:hypothetical protein